MDLSPGNHDFRAILSRLANKFLDKDIIEAEKFADKNLVKYWNWLKITMDEHLNRSLHPYFVVPERRSFSIACASHELGACSNADSQYLGKYLKLRSSILRQIDQLNDREYEALAGVTCDAIGAENFFLTRPGNEGGIDFVAVIANQNDTHSFPKIGSNLRIIGQCKKYASPLAVDKFEQFLQTMQNVRHRSDRVKEHIPVWFQSSRAPIVGWMISHNGFQSGAADEAKQHGIILSDSLDLTEILSQSKISSHSPLERLVADILAKSI
jgi:hypothetical protein